MLMRDQNSEGFEILCSVCFPFSQLLFLVFRVHAFQTAILVCFFKKFLYESCLKKSYYSIFLKKLITK